MPDASAIKNALDIRPDSGPAERTIDITTTGAKSGDARRIEIWFHQIDGRWYITGVPPRKRAWYSNLVANPEFTFHLKNGVQADLGATARPVTDASERQQVFEALVAGLNDPAVSTGIPSMPPAEDWIESSPLVEVSFNNLAT